MAIILKSNFDNFQDALAPDDKSDYKNYEQYKNSGKWVRARLISKVVESEGELRKFYLLFEITSGDKINTVDAPEPPFGTGNGRA